MLSPQFKKQYYPLVKYTSRATIVLWVICAPSVFLIMWAVHTAYSNSIMALGPVMSGTSYK